MQLCGLSLSPFYERNLILLDLKGQVDKVETPGVPGGFKSEEHLRICPTGKIPFLLKDDGSLLIEGQVIAEYLDGLLDGPKLLPADPDARAQVQMICRIIDLYIAAGMSPMSVAVFRGIRDDAKIEKAKTEDFPKAVNLLGWALSKRGKRAVGDSWTIADCAMIPIMFHFKNAVARFDVDALAINADVTAWWESVKDEPVVHASHGRMQKVFDLVVAAAARKAG
ncbi:glutathione S-transferase family protein [Pseudokordiimonas caeni]|uniref:glutathione S-transferase family protein n=1 Tax=Pseudokordiimonas caeni TaxID=2997908 RepID=UPI00281284A1|nr:glutathione S-transferase family protein [Pseudokordiimonas caeni]